MYLRKLITNNIVPVLVCVPKVGIFLMQMCMLIQGIHKINENSIPTLCVDPDILIFFLGGGRGEDGYLVI